MRQACAAGTLAVVVGALACVTACQQEVRVVERTTTIVVIRDAAAAAPGEPPVARTLGDERRANEEAYRALYVPQRERLVAEHRGKWLAIVDGRVVPSGPGGPAPTQRLAEADAAARAAAPRAKHRFVFPVGEDGDVEWPMGGCELKHVLGVRFLALLERDDVEIRGYGPDEPVRALFSGALREITVKGPDSRMYVQPELGPPGGEGKASELYCLSTGFAGVATVAATTAAGAHLEMWEVPGTADVLRGVPEGQCRRAVARFAWPGSELDFVAQVAIWPE